MDKVNCFCCDEELHNQEYTGMKHELYPTGGLQFISYGHYGTTIFDPMGLDIMLEIAICDECMKKKKDRIHGSGKENALESIEYLESAK